MAANPALEAKAPKALQTPTAFSPDAVSQVSKALNVALADTLALYLKTKNFHWHVSGPHFRDYHVLFDAQGSADPSRHGRHRRAREEDRRQHAEIHRACGEATACEG
jgi:hypothetical protein